MRSNFSLKSQRNHTLEHKGTLIIYYWMRVIPKAFVDISPSPRSVQQRWPDQTPV